MILATLIGGILIGCVLPILLFLVMGLSHRISQLEKAGLEIYQAGFWKAEGLSAYRSAELWTKFRNTFRIPPGTATAAGVGDTFPAPPSKYIKKASDR